MQLVPRKIISRMKVRRVMLILLIIVLFLSLFLLYSVLKIRFHSRPVSVRHDFSRLTGDAKLLFDHVHHLSSVIGSRSAVEYDRLDAAREYIVSRLRLSGCDPELQSFRDGGRVFSNIIVTMKGTRLPEEVVVIGAHYDTVIDTPGADDNASAVALLLEICRRLADTRFDRTLKLIFFVLEEPPAFGTASMGSYFYAREAKSRNEKIVAMASLEMLGYYSDRENAQSFPFPLMGLIYPTTPDFVAVVGNFASRGLAGKIRRAITAGSGFPAESLAVSGAVPGVDLSDHWPFWKMGYHAVMITDTAFYRNPHYHTDRDTEETLDYARMAVLLKGLLHAAGALSTVDARP